MSTQLESLAPLTDVTLVKLARELAMDIHPLADILKAHQIEPKDWDYIQDLPRFQNLLETEVAQWNGALNTHERVRIKAAALVEEWLPELCERMHDRGETLNSKIEAGKLAARLAGMGLTGTGVSGGGEGLKVTINLGGDSQLTFEKSLPPVIDGEAEEL
jgi:hypothetical protein